MHMAFWFGYNIKDFLFHGLSVNTIPGLTLLCFSLVGLAVAFEGLKVLLAEAKLRSVLLCTQFRPNLYTTHDSTTLLGDIPENIKRKKALCYLLEVSLYVVQVILGYLLMLSVMTYNGYVSLAILLGVALGYLFFGQILVERRIKNTKLIMPCQHCLQSEEKTNTEVTVIDDDDDGGSSSGCCSRNAQVDVAEISD